MLDLLDELAVADEGGTHSRKGQERSSFLPLVLVEEV